MPTDVPDRTLYQFPISHYCEKSRWNMDAKGLAYATQNIMPGIHRLVAGRYAGTRTLPVLVDRTVAIGDSTAIGLYLDREYPTRLLIPTSGPDRARVLALEDHFDTVAGPAVLSWLWHQLLSVPGLAVEVMFSGYGPRTRAVGHALRGVFALGVRQTYKISRASAERGRAALDVTLDRLETEIQGDPGRYLACDKLTLADIAAASLLGPLVAPEGTPWGGDPREPEAVTALRSAVRARPAGQWVLARYARDRYLTAAV